MGEADPWSIERTQQGYAVYLDDRPWIGEPLTTKTEAQHYLERLRDRYPNTDEARSLCEPGETEQNGRQRGGPWRWTIPEDAKAAAEFGRTGVVHTARKKDAKSMLRRKMDRQRLPNGITWELETT